MSGRRLFGNLALLVGGTSAALLMSEGLLRLLRPQGTFRAADELPDFRSGGGRIHAAYEIDSELGFRPLIDGPHYDRYGTMRNGYPIEKRRGVTRLLFIGDSVTRRGRLVAALRSLYGEDSYEYWNAGVESFNTVQEVRFYQRYNAAIDPDHVILTFHPNDFQTTPVAFMDAANHLVVLAPRMPARRVNRWLFAHSLGYRALMGLLSDKQRNQRGIAEEVRDNLATLKQSVEASGARLTILVLPLLQPVETWPEQDRSRHALILDILAELRIRHFDLEAPLVRALADGIKVTERQDDPWHPSDGAADYLAAFLREHGLL